MKRTARVDDDVAWLQARQQRFAFFDIDLRVRRSEGIDSPLAQRRGNRGAEDATASEQHDSPQASLRPNTTHHGQKSAKSTAEHTATPTKLPANVNTLSPNPAPQIVQVQIASQPFKPGVASVSSAPATVYRPLPGPPVSRLAAGATAA